MISVFFSCSILTRNLIKIICAMCRLFYRSIITCLYMRFALTYIIRTSFYCSALWSTYTPKSVMDEIHTAHNDVYRLLFKLPRGFISGSQHFLAAGIPNFTMIRRRHMYSLYKLILSSSNVITNAITDSFTFISILYEEWLQELF